MKKWADLLTTKKGASLNQSQQIVRTKVGQKAYLFRNLDLGLLFDQRNQRQSKVNIEINIEIENRLKLS